MTAITATCGNCRHWALSRNAGTAGPRGHCRRYAPRGPAPLDAAPFPTTAQHQSCGEHERQQTWPERLEEMEREEGA